MPLRVFETDPDAMPKPRPSYADETIGRFHSGRMVGKRPESLPTWRVTTGDRDVAAAIAQSLGGQAVETDSTSENFIEIMTGAESVQVLLDGPKAIDADFKLWRGNKLVHHCDGVEFLSPEDKAGTLCGCPPLLADRKQAAKDFEGPPPSITFFFRLAEDPELGKFKFVTGSWTLVEVLHEYENALAAIGGEAVATLTLELVEYTTKAGRFVSYRKPVLTGIRSYNSAIAEDF
jgi:hypothetical protein